MSKRFPEIFLFDILVASLKIEETIKNFQTAQDLLSNFQAWDSVIREFEIIGEATNKLIKAGILDERYREIVDFRNLLIHNYFGVDPDEVWDIAINDLPAFKKDIMVKISEIESNLKNELIDAYIEYNNYLRFVVDSLNKLKDI